MTIGGDILAKVLIHDREILRKAGPQGKTSLCEGFARQERFLEDTADATGAPISRFENKNLFKDLLNSS